MPGRITELSETQIVADLLHASRRQGRALTEIQVPQPAKDSFTVASTPATTYQLTAIPYQGTGGSSLNLSLNGLELVEGVDYTCDYTTAVVTVSATLKGTPTPADVLTADYWTTGDLIAFSGPPDIGGFSDNFNRANSTTTLGSPWVPWGASDSPYNTSVWGISSNRAYLTSVLVNMSTIIDAVAYVETGTADGTLELDLPTVVSGAALAAFRIVPGTSLATRSYFVLYPNDVYWLPAGSGGIPLGWGLGLTSGDHIAITLSGSSITVYKNGVSQGTKTSTNNVSATKHGIASTDITARYDNFSWTPA